MDQETRKVTTSSPKGKNVRCDYGKANDSQVVTWLINTTM